ncbi:MAG: hypothetical protein ACERKK_13230, partial [Poseidonibacter sp.]|uniref:hypothetical protein n=1 Tax=Poseidonibacter sp. TaxID=2321188 RepID=UPI00359E97F7
GRLLVQPFLKFGLQNFSETAAIFHGADITWMDIMVKNSIPATLGNIIGGGLLQGAEHRGICIKFRR